MSESNPNESQDVLAAFEQGNDVSSSVSEEELGVRSEEWGIETTETTQATEDLLMDDSETNNSQLTTHNSSKRLPELNEADEQKMHLMVSLQLFIIIWFFYYLVVIMTVSWVTLDFLGLSTFRLSQLHFVLYPVFLFSVMQTVIRWAYYFGLNIFDSYIPGGCISFVSWATFVFLCLVHFGFGDFVGTFLDFLPFF